MGSAVSVLSAVPPFWGEFLGDDAQNQNPREVVEVSPRNGMRVRIEEYRGKRVIVGKVGQNAFAVIDRSCEEFQQIRNSIRLGGMEPCIISDDGLLVIDPNKIPAGATRPPQKVIKSQRGMLLLWEGAV